jgi:hypothetical protein
MDEGPNPNENEKRGRNWTEFHRPDGKMSFGGLVGESGDAVSFRTEVDLDEDDHIQSITMTPFLTPSAPPVKNVLCFFHKMDEK